MGITILAAHMILAEHRHRPITGNAIMIARHFVDLTRGEMGRLLRAMDVPERPGVPYELDTDTVGHATDRPTITDRSFFAAFSDAEIRSLDVSDYEKADIVCNLEDPLPEELHGCADFVFDGGSLDNIFNPAAALQNMSRMLRPGGRILAVNTGGPHSSAYLKFSPDWFMDYFAVNNYADAKVYVCHYPNTVDLTIPEQRAAKRLNRSPHSAVIYSFNPYVVNAGGAGYDASMLETSARFEIACLAEKGPDSTDDRSPIQKNYRVDPWHKERCLTSVRRFLESPRPLFSNPAEFHPSGLLRLDDSLYPEQLRAVGVINAEYLHRIGYEGVATR